MSWHLNEQAMLALPLLLVLRVILLLPGRQRKDVTSRKKGKGEQCSLGVFLGSGMSAVHLRFHGVQSNKKAYDTGGHTAEMCTLLSSIPFDRYSSRTYIYCPGDEHSLRLVRELEGRKSGSLTAHTFLPLPRARKVKQPVMTTVFTTIGTLLVAIVTLFMVPLVKHPLRPPFEVLLVNGPGTCVVVVAVCWIRRILGLRYTQIIYVESFARVTSLSLSAKLLRPFVDSFVVQWPQLAEQTEASRMDVDKKAISTDKRGGLVRQWLAGRTIYKGWLV